MEELLDPELGAALVNAARGPGFATLLLETARRFEPVEEIYAYRTVGALAPEALLSSSVLPNADKRATLYAGQFHKDDPAVLARTSVRAGRGFVQRVRSCEIYRTDYRSLCFERPSFVDKTCFGWRGEAQSLVLTFYRRAGGHDDPEQTLSALAMVALTALVRRKEIRPDLPTRLEVQLARSYPQLSFRERQVCARTLAGWTAETTAKCLGVSPSTVLTYRQRAYQRLGYSQASDFLETILG